MKKTALINRIPLLAFIFAALNLAAFSQSTEKANVKEAKIKTSAVCEMCKTKIEKTLKKTDGVIEGILDVDTKIATVKYDPSKTDLEKIRTAISKAGYDADGMAADKRAYNKLSPCCKKDAKK